MKFIFVRNFRSLGTEVEIFLVIEDGKNEKDAKQAVENVEKIYKQKEAVLSRFEKQSELSKLNSRLNIFSNTASEILYLAQKSLEYYESSGGYFDPRILDTLEGIGYKKDFKENVFAENESQEDIFFPKNNLADDLKIKNERVLFGRRMDFSGIAKGYITDLVASHLAESGWQNFLINSGGDIFAKGRNEKDEKWGIGIEGISEEKIILKLENSAAATSGITRRKWELGGKKYHHLINPKKPKEFSFDLKSVTVVEKTCERADVAAKMLYLMGKTEGAKYAKKKNIPSIFLDYRGNVFLPLGAKNQQIIF